MTFDPLVRDFGLDDAEQHEQQTADHDQGGDSAQVHAPASLSPDCPTWVTQRSIAGMDPETGTDTSALLLSGRGVAGAGQRQLLRAYWSEAVWVRQSYREWMLADTGGFIS
jgi:hypothetical protein